MALQLEIVSEHADLVGDDAKREFNENGGTIGRSLRNDWILPDPDRFISGRHATIDYKGGIYYLLDTSSNGVYINDDEDPIGKGNPRRLFNGDRIRMGDFELAVTIDSGEDLDMPAKPRPTVVPDNIEQLVDEDSPETGVKMLDEEEITGDDVFEKALASDGAKPPAKATDKAPKRKKSRSRSKSKRSDEGERKGERKRKRSSRSRSAEAKRGVKKLAATPAPSNDDSDGASPDEIFDAFLTGLGINRVELHPAVNRPEVMLTAGHILREFVEGTIKLMAARASLKNAFRLDQTSILPRYNNPLKVSESPGDLIKQLLVGDEGDYLGAKDAVHEACNDLLNHQNAFLDAMNSAFIEFADRFAPEELQNGFDRALGDAKLFSFNNKSKYWDLYRDIYPIMTEKGGGRFPQMFGEEFVKAYERQVAEYQRLDRERQANAVAANDPVDTDAAGSKPKPEHLLATQRFDASKTAPESTPEVDNISDTISETLAEALDHRFIEDLDKSIAEETSRKRKA